MILDAEKGFGQKRPHYDLCIVGAGAAGISLALQLEATDLKICLLEAGGLRYERTTQELFEGETRPANYPRLRDTHLAAFGGTTQVWAGWCRPLEDFDFETRNWCRAVGWPFGLEHLLPYYERAHEFCGLGAMQYEPESWSHVLGERSLLCNEPDFTHSIFHVHAQDFGDRYFPVVRTSRKIDLILHAPITRIVMDASAHKATHVDIRTLNGYETKIGADNFVLAAGGVENARLLLVSADSETSAPGNAGGLVGRYFADHPFVDPGALILHDTPGSLRFFRPQPIDLNRRSASVRGVLSFNREFLERERLMNAALFVYPRYESHPAFESDEVKALLQLWAKFGKRAVPGAVWPLVMRAARAPHRLAVAFLRKLLVRDGPALRWRLRMMFETEFVFENRVVLGDDRDQLGRRRPRIEWRLSDQDLHNMSRLTFLFEQAVQRAGVGRVERRFADEPDAWRQAAEGGKHHMGTTRMHVDSRLGVVDENSRVHNTSNLYVTGSSVFPSGGYANPTLTIIALAIRLADYLKRVSAA